ncbi:MAG: DUF4837 family protein, partial [Cyclobacteriaceae bacterium]
GASGEVVLVMDSAAWQGELGDELREIFLKAMPGLPQPEPYFSVRYVDPFKLNKVLKNAKNMLFVATLDNESQAGRRMQNYFTDASVERMKLDSNLFRFSKENMFARGQEVLFLFGTTEEALINNLQENRPDVRSFFHKVEIERLQKSLYKANERKGISRTLMNEHGFSIRVPHDYQIVPLDHKPENFVWLRSVGDEVDKSIVVAYEDYTTEDAFTPEGIMDLRKRIMKNNIKDDSTTYMTIQDLAPVEFDTLNFNGKYAIETRGRWRMHEVAMGGPFVSYTVVDQAKNRLYYIEGFVYSPGQQKRPLIREVEAILRTFETISGEQQPQQASS